MPFVRQNLQHNEDFFAFHPERQKPTNRFNPVNPVEKTMDQMMTK
jgi:hypothetical protein